ncbi:SDR family NAD(P)-dependent oxidoreductase [Lyngbya aestuarii]|uniref:SDR family NAD(P)-dependent oxidoreductase n=1 Tax=Lyngbya aestuarii TaxID=118322 RepID=UPI00403D68FC
MTTLQIKPSSVFLVSGGARGITAKCVIRLAQNSPCKWILLGRSKFTTDEPAWAKDCFSESELKKRIMEDLRNQGEKPTPKVVQSIYKKIASQREIAQTLQTLEQTGSQAEYLSVDVTDAIALKEKLTGAVERLGPIKGIIHGAGNLADKLIEKKTEQDFDCVYQTKIKGLENLLSYVPASQLDYLVFFSSVAGFCGNAGQADYALANEILNKSAHLVKQLHPACHVVAINWGPWDSGMVTPELKKAFASRNIEILPIEAGTQMLLQELADTNHQTAQVIIGSQVPPMVKDFDSELRSYRIYRQIAVDANPFLYDHMIAGYPVLPFTCAISWMAHASEQIHPGYKCFSCENARVLKGIIFDENAASEYVLDLKEITKNPEEIQLEAKIWSKNKEGKIRYHFSTQVKIRREIPAAPVYDLVNMTPDHIISGSRKSFYQNGPISLFHGPTFQGIERVVNISPTTITTECVVHRVSEKQQGNFTVQGICPYIADVQTHCVLLWIQHFQQSLCLPAKLDKFEQFAPIKYGQPFYSSMELLSKTDTGLKVNMISYNQQGEIYTRMAGGQATIIPLHLAVA